MEHKGRTHPAAAASISKGFATMPQFIIVTKMNRNAVMTMSLMVLSFIEARIHMGAASIVIAAIYRPRLVKISNFSSSR